MGELRKGKADGVAPPIRGSREGKEEGWGVCAGWAGCWAVWAVRVCVGFGGGARFGLDRGFGLDPSLVLGTVGA